MAQAALLANLDATISSRAKPSDVNITFTPLAGTLASDRVTGKTIYAYQSFARTYVMQLLDAGRTPCRCKGEISSW